MAEPARGRGTITGVVGLIRWGHYRAAAINDYRVRFLLGTWTLEATVVAADAFNLTRSPLTFVAPLKKGEWRWPIRTLRRPSGGIPSGPFPIQAALGPPETRPV